MKSCIKLNHKDTTKFNQETKLRGVIIFSLINISTGKSKENIIKKEDLDWRT